ncbi:MAG TPA: glycosyltransferase family 4 protein [Terriglobales bacterium]|nr:glycosyltransferase family 4 protein [Terriglobales bacterium]
MRLRAESATGATVHVLLTADTLSGTWTYTQELVTGLVNRGVRVTLVSLGDIPLPDQTSWMEKLDGLDYHPTAFRLDWMQDGDKDFLDSSRYLASLARELKPDLLHLNQLCYGSLPVNAPRIVVAHGDLVSWWKAVHEHEPKDSRWLRWYKNLVNEGVAAASMVVAPSVWMLETVRACYGRPEQDAVIYNGRNPIFFNPYVSKNDSVLAVGRLLDVSKQVSLLTQHVHPLPVCIVNSNEPVATPNLPICTDVTVQADESSVSLKGTQTEAQLRMLYSRAAIYVATARYEASGLSTLEAALSRCAIVANDIPFYREMWGDAAVYFRANDGASLAEVIRRLHERRDLCRGYAARAFQRARECFTAKRMTEEYVRLYSRLLGATAAAA